MSTLYQQVAKPHHNAITTKTCSKCNLELAISDFRSENSGKTIRNSCISCDRKRSYVRVYGEPAWHELTSRKSRIELLRASGMKTCAMCNKELNYSSFTKNKCNSDGLNTRCRDCSGRVWKERRDAIASPDKIARRLRVIELRNNGEQECSDCKEVKKIFEFRPKRHVCRKCLNEKTRQYRIPKHSELRMKSKIIYYSDPVNSLYIGARSRAKKGKREFNLSIEYLRKLWDTNKGCCSISQIPFDFNNEKSKFGKSPYRPSLDRIDNAKGYIEGNVRFILWALNLSLNEYGMEVYLCIARKVIESTTSVSCWD